ncbi:MAG: aryl-sulfate sulfotransferase [Planctomycetes bacterium]|nr:aryl-sulfate sulfotransferase [Planctomycetota bacterium]
MTMPPFALPSRLSVRVTQALFAPLLLCTWASAAPAAAVSTDPQEAPGVAQDAATPAGNDRGASAAEVESGEPEARRARGLKLRTERAFDGYTLLAPLQSTSTFLVGLDGEVVHEWTSDAPPGQATYLRENGHLLRAERIDNDVFYGGGEGGRVREYDHAGNVVWEYVCSDSKRRAHHDFKLLPNGHVLLIAWEYKSGEEAFDAGRDPALLEAAQLWPDMLLELELTPPSGGKVVWEWHAWDHLIQERDPKKPNHGKVAEHPERIDVNADRPARSAEDEARELEDLRRLGYVGDGPRQTDPGANPRDGAPRGRPMRGGDWLHTNAVAYEPTLDLIAISVHSLSEIWILDHSTTTAEARTSRGGRYGKGGDLLARFGNPRVHGAGPSDAQFLFGQHDVQWIAAGSPGAGHLLVFNNGQGKPGGGSSVDEFELDLSLDSVRRGMPAARRVWSYAHADIDSGHISGAQRQPNGNTLICAGESGRVIEVAPDGTVVWDYASPLRGEVRAGGRRPPRGAGPGADRDGGRAGARDGGPPPAGAGGPNGRRRPGGPDMDHGLFRAPRYAAEDPGVEALLGRPAETFELAAGRLVLSQAIEFDGDSAAPTPASDVSLAKIARWLRARRDVTKARIEVHVDLAGEPGLELSKRRAKALAANLVGRGVDCSRLVIVGFGDSKPVADASTPAGRAANRRVEVRVAELRGRAVGGEPLDGGGASAGDPCGR